jgi:hypothetical protein
MIIPLNVKRFRRDGILGRPMTGFSVDPSYIMIDAIQIRLFQFQIKDEIKAARKRRRGVLQEYVEEPMTKPTMIAL